VGEVAEIALRRCDMGPMASQRTSQRMSRKRLQLRPLSQRKRQVLRRPERRESLAGIG
jgi:hypothetical protein